MSLVIIPVYGLPASGKTRIVTSVSKRLFDIKTTNVSVIELDDLLQLQQLTKQQNKDASTSSPVNDCEFDITKWFEAREKFSKKIEEKVKKWTLSEMQSRKEATANATTKKNSVIFAVDNLPLKSMRNRIRSLALKTIRSTIEEEEEKEKNDNTTSINSDEHNKFYFFPVGVTIPTELALERNSQRVEKVPSVIIQQMSSRVEIEKDFDFILDNSNPMADQVGKLETSLVRIVEENFITSTTTSSGKPSLSTSSSRLNEIQQKYVVSLQRDNNNNSISGGDENVSEEVLHKASRTLSHQFDLLRRQANAAVLQTIIGQQKEKEDKKGEVVVIIKDTESTTTSVVEKSNNLPQSKTQKIAKMLSDKKFVEVDRKILAQCGEDLELAKMMLQSAREPLLR